MMKFSNLLYIFKLLLLMSKRVEYLYGYFALYTDEEWNLKGIVNRATIEQIT